MGSPPAHDIFDFVISSRDAQVLLALHFLGGAPSFHRRVCVVTISDTYIVTTDDRTGVPIDGL